MGGAPMAAAAPPGGNADYGEAGGQEPAENLPPTSEETIKNLGFLQNLVLEENKKEVLSRIIQKQQEKSNVYKIEPR